MGAWVLSYSNCKYFYLEKLTPYTLIYKLIFKDTRCIITFILNQFWFFNPLLITILWHHGRDWHESIKKQYKTILWTSGMCIKFNYHHGIKQKDTFILPFVMPKPGSYSWKMIPSLYPTPRVNHVNLTCNHWYCSLFNSVWLVFEMIFLKF